MKLKLTSIARVLEESGEPIEGAEVWVWYSNPRPDGKGGVVDGVRESGFTNHKGIVVTRENGRAGISTRVKKEGYYPHGHYPAEKDYFGSTGMPKVLEKEVTLRRIINPTALYARRTATIQIPVQREWIGYDFEQGDLLEPYGRGNKADILFRYENKFIGFRESSSRTMEERLASYQRKCDRKGILFTEDGFRKAIGNWEGVLEITFPEEKEGIVRVIDDYMPHSVLHMPHLAPVDGYKPIYTLETTNYLHPEKQRFTSVRKDTGFFLRTRVILDEEGEIKSANYTKMHREFSFDPRGTLSFSYYFNPVPNDRNLEFDPKQNLFPEGTPGTFNFVLP